MKNSRAFPLVAVTVPAGTPGAAAAHAQTAAKAAAALSVDNPDCHFTAYKDSPALFTTVQNEDDTLPVRGVFLRERACLLDGRLLGRGGLRHDSTTNVTRNRVSATTTVTDPATGRTVTLAHGRQTSRAASLISTGS